MDNASEVLPKEFALMWESSEKTKWLNPLDTVQTFSIFVGIGKDQWGCDINAEVQIKVPARGAALVPRQYDDCIHSVRSGLVVAGLAPLLLREGQTYGVSKYLIPTKVRMPETAVGPEDLGSILSTGRSVAEDEFLRRASK